MNQYADAAERLHTILVAEEKLYLEMRQLLQLERELILRLDAMGIEDVVRRKEMLADEGRLLEESRIDVVAELGGVLDIDDPTPTLSRLCEALGEHGRGLAAVHSRLVALTGAVRELLRANTAFAGESLSRVQGTLRLLGRLMPDSPTYGREGTTPLEAGRGRLVRQAV